MLVLCHFVDHRSDKPIFKIWDIIGRMTGIEIGECGGSLELIGRMWRMIGIEMEDGWD